MQNVMIADIPYLSSCLFILWSSTIHRSFRVHSYLYKSSYVRHILKVFWTGSPQNCQSTMHTGWVQELVSIQLSATSQVQVYTCQCTGCTHCTLRVYQEPKVGNKMSRLEIKEAKSSTENSRSQNENNKLLPIICCDSFANYFRLLKIATPSQIFVNI